MGFQSDDNDGSHSSTILMKRSRDLVCHRSYGTEESQLLSSQFRNGDDPTVPPPDHGIAAWLFLFGCFWLDGLVWGEYFSIYRVNRLLMCSRPSFRVRCLRKLLYESRNLLESTSHRFHWDNWFGKQAIRAGHSIAHV